MDEGRAVPSIERSVACADLGVGASAVHNVSDPLPISGAIQAVGWTSVGIIERARRWIGESTSPTFKALVQPATRYQCRPDDLPSQAGIYSAAPSLKRTSGYRQ